MEDLIAVRRAFANALKSRARIRSDALVEAFAKVPRESFIGPPPWQIWDPEAVGPFEAGAIPYVTYRENDPSVLYRDVLVALDASRGINNGQPSLWAFVYDQSDAHSGEHVVHVGCGVGYYTAILAEMVGPQGSVVGIDIDPAMVARARAALSTWRNVEVREANGAHNAGEPADLIIVNAGVTRPLDIWLDALNQNGRLMLPLTYNGAREEAGFGAFFRVTREADGYSVRYLCPTGIFHCVGARDPGGSMQLEAAMRDKNADLTKIASLRRDKHSQAASCWLHGEGYCLSLEKPSSIH